MLAEGLLIIVFMALVVLPVCYAINRTAMLGIKNPDWPVRVSSLITIAAEGALFCFYLSRWIGVSE